jgi:hypothetical protein
MINGRMVELSSDYSDDVAIFLGSHRMYIKRHLIRASQELLTIFRRIGIAEMYEQKQSEVLTAAYGK